MDKQLTLTEKTVVSFDLGIGDHTSVIVGQIVGAERRILHAYENSGYAIVVAPVASKSL